jgi:hypothetical protein
MPIKSFRGLIADGSIDTISLHTNNGSVGYRIVKLDVIANDPGTDATEHVVKIFTVPQTTATEQIDFADNTLLGVGVTISNNNLFAGQEKIIFDNMTFNQDIFITHVDVNSDKPVNYYIELEQIRLDLNQNTVATLKDIRNIKSQ